MHNQKILNMKFSAIYPLYIAKLEKKNRTVSELDKVIFWLTGYDEEGLKNQLNKAASLEEFFTHAPKKNANSSLITGKVCGVKVEEIEDDTLRYIRYLDKLVDELAKGKKMQQILRGSK